MIPNKNNPADSNPADSEPADHSLFLNIPINPDAEEVLFQIFADGLQIDEQKLPISSCPALWAPIPLGEHVGKEITIEFEENDIEIDEPTLRGLMEFSNKPHDSETSYKEPLRPLVHFSAKRGFVNDPNGLFYYNGTYHMFFQHNPYNLAHGNTHWGHAVSNDLLHWNELDPAIKPDRTDGNIFSGSAVVDYSNTSGLQQGEHPPILLFYTATGMRFYPRLRRLPNSDKPAFPSDWVRPKTKQCVAYSIDGGHTFRKYENNPIIDEIAPMNRDPKVVWNQDTDCWVMALYLSKNDFVLLYSDNLLSWEQGQVISLQASGECPDLFELYADDDIHSRKWVIFVSPENYIIGHFNGRNFYAETETIKGPTQINEGEQKVFLQAPAYAPQTFFGIQDSRAIQLSWITTRFPGTTFASCMSLPWELKLVANSEGYRLIKSPSFEVLALRGDFAETYSNDPTSATVELSSVSGEALDLVIELDMIPDGMLAFVIRGVLIVYEHARRTLLFPTGKYPLPVFEILDIRIIADRGSIELFACGGLFNCVLNSPLDPTKKTVEILKLGASHSAITLYKLNTIW